ncbi:aldehyde dehydrogenase family protein [Clostridium intestinale]|uniref:aldehyde dehydrogenase (NAD(+)) n=1 Tax=Clostridium intestinale DSM 6191 TaxID=1121320 RepID=A0A1M5YI05_9CLOT|nr:aldehyde dehydrogenase family protein [Clostridium intestinale]SHI11671.1 betaine-aldehyde dehydrogenase [Clostridium intestinale DSM 6191]
MDVKKMYIDGEWVTSSSEEIREIINPATGKVIETVAEGTAEDVKKAVAAAKRAFYEDGWMETTAIERASYLYKIADKLESMEKEFSEIDTLDNGKPLRETAGDVQDGVACLRYYAGLVNKPSGQIYEVPDPNMQSMVVREPIGVCGQIIPWNYPLLMALWKIAPALAAGNTIVFKPSEVTPLSAIKLFEVIESVGIPKGVANLVMGAGAVVGHEIAANMDIDKVAFTGGTKTGRSIMQAATGNIKNISLELGGKSPNIVFADADFETAVDYALFGIFCNQGQVCSAGSRLILEDKIYNKFIERLVERAKKIKVGLGFDPETEMGPLVSKIQMDKVLNYIEIGKKEGAKLVCGGNKINTEELKDGFFVEPTIFIDTTPDMTIVKEEIFGPVLVVQKFTGEEEAIKLANDTVYGLAGAVFTQDGAKAMRVIKKLRAGITWVNSYHPTFNEAPWGGYKQSGIGRELGTFGLEEYTEVKQININLKPEPLYWFKE